MHTQIYIHNVVPVVIQLFSHVWLFVTHWTTETRLSCPSLSPGACSNSCPLSQWCHPTISSSVTPFSSCPQSFSASGSFPMGWLFASSGQSIVASTSISVLPMNIQGWFPLGWMGLISLHYFRQMKSYNLYVASETTRCSVLQRDQGMKYGTAVLLEKYKWPNLSVGSKIH